MRGLATLPQRWIQEPLVVRDKDGRPPRRHPGSGLLLCVCSGSALLGDLLGVSKSKKRDLLSVLLIYPKIFLLVFIVYHFLVGFLFVRLYSAIC